MKLHLHPTILVRILAHRRGLRALDELSRRAPGRTILGIERDAGKTVSVVRSLALIRHVGVARSLVAYGQHHEAATLVRAPVISHIGLSAGGEMRVAAAALKRFVLRFQRLHLHV